jgi:hypothetical protein
MIDSLQNFGDFLIYFGIVILPWLVVLSLVIYDLYRFIQRRAGKK